MTSNIKETQITNTTRSLLKANLNRKLKIAFSNPVTLHTYSQNTKSAEMVVAKWNDKSLVSDNLKTPVKTSRFTIFQLPCEYQ